jgi:hypothetical protein
MQEKYIYKAFEAETSFAVVIACPTWRWVWSAM